MFLIPSSFLKAQNKNNKCITPNINIPKQEKSQVFPIIAMLNGNRTSLFHFWCVFFLNGKGQISQDPKESKLEELVALYEHVRVSTQQENILKIPWPSPAWDQRCKNMGFFIEILAFAWTSIVQNCLFKAIVFPLPWGKHTHTASTKEELAYCKDTNTPPEAIPFTSPCN